MSHRPIQQSATAICKSSQTQHRHIWAKHNETKTLRPGRKDGPEKMREWNKIQRYEEVKRDVVSETHKEHAGI